MKDKQGDEPKLFNKDPKDAPTTITASTDAAVGQDRKIDYTEKVRYNMPGFVNGSMDTIFEIEQINSRVAADINTHTSHTNEIVSLDEKARERHLKRDMPELINKKDQEKLNNKNTIVDTKMPLS